MRPDETGEPLDDRSIARGDESSDTSPWPCAPGSDADAFPDDELVRGETHRLRRLAARLLANEHDREDLIQEVWLESVERPPADRGGARSWLWVVATHAASRLGRRTRSRAARERQVAKPELVSSVLDSLEHEAARAELRRWVDGLKDPYREIVRLHYLDDVSLREIAQQLQRPEATVRSQLRRGLEQLRSRYTLPHDDSVGTGRKRASAWFPWFAWFARRDAQKRVARFPRAGLAAAAVAAGLVGVSLVVIHRLRSLPEDALGDRTSAAMSIAAEPLTSDALDLAERNAALESRMSESSAGAQGAMASQAADASAPVPAFAVRGRAIDVLGNPVENAVVWASPAADYEPGLSIGLSDVDGRFRTLEMREDVWIWAESLEHGLTGRVRVHVPGANDIVECGLRFGANLGRVSGLVHDSRGAPIVGAQVRSLLLQTGRMSIGWQGEELAAYTSAATPTDAAGRFEMSRIQAPRVDVLVTAEGHAPHATWFAGSGLTDLAIVMPDAAALEVNVRRPDGTPAAGVAVELEHPDPLPSSTGETDAHGTFRFERVPPGPFRWIAQESTGAAPLSIVHDGNLRPGESLALGAMTLSPAWTIRGTATCGSRALSNWTVSLIDNTDTLSPWQNRTTNTAVDGRFAFAGCVGTDYTLRLRPAGRSSGIAHASVAGVAPGASEIRLSFEERSESSAFVRGTLPEIEIAAGHAVIVTAFRAGNPASTDGAAETLVDRGSRRFEIGPLPPGEFELHATHSSLGRWKIADVAVHPGAEIDLGRVSAPRSGTLLVRWSQSWGSIDENFSLVIDGQGVQIGGRRDHSAARFEVDEAARTIRIPGLLAGRYSVLVQGQRIASELRSVHIAPDEESKVDVALRQGTPVEVRLKSPRLLTARESVAVKIHAQEETLEFTVFERPRVFDLDAVAQFRSVLALGSHRIEVVTSGGLRGERTIHIRDSEPVGVVTLELR